MTRIEEKPDRFKKFDTARRNIGAAIRDLNAIMKDAGIDNKTKAVLKQSSKELSKNLQSLGKVSSVLAKESLGSGPIDIVRVGNFILLGS